jgi:hypothetical protein
MIQTASAALVGATAGVITTPIDLVKTRVQTADSRLSITHAFRLAYQEGTLFSGGATRAFYVALAVTCMNAINHFLPSRMPKAFYQQ